MQQHSPKAESGSSSRRTFLKQLAVVGAAITALPLLRNPFARASESPRNIPADLPGEGSIFQPRNDNRRQR
ncbi:MAG: twin-arginine translocation signal domain-containing protein [Dehalococcoidia bacterium]